LSAQLATRLDLAKLTSPFPLQFCADLLAWCNESAVQAMDDFWPKTVEALWVEIERRSKTEQTNLISNDGSPVGYIGYCRINSHVGTLRGVCFAKSVHGDGTALRALRKVLWMAFDSGVHKVMAFPFSDNARAIAFYEKLGAETEGLLLEQTLRDGRLTDVACMAFFADKDGHAF
jgi:RimJ/RimL family protein N-acetyltransferase